MTGDKPYFMQLLAARGIRAPGYFCIDGREPGCYSVSRAYKIRDLQGNPAPLTENEIWENLDHIRRLTRAQFGAARTAWLEAQRAKAGKKTDRQLAPLASAFAQQYAGARRAQALEGLRGLDEETLLRLLWMAAGLCAPRSRTARRALFDAMRADALRARFAMPGAGRDL